MSSRILSPGPKKQDRLGVTHDLERIFAPTHPLGAKFRSRAGLLRSGLLQTVFALAALIGLAFPAAATEIGAPVGEVVLTVTGAIGAGNAAKEANFDLAMLEALPENSFLSETPWYDEKKTFSGPRISTVLDAVGATGKTVRIVAINDYYADIPIEEVNSYGVILATRMNGDRMSVREKGPIFVVYPFDNAPELYDELHFGRSVWQVKSIEVF